MSTVELRWAVPEGTTTEAPRLQYRQCGDWPSAPGDWMDVPLVAVPPPGPVCGNCDTAVPPGCRGLFKAGKGCALNRNAGVKGTLPRRWVERWFGSGADRGWWVWEAEHGDRIAYCGEGEFAERLCSRVVEKHNAACGVTEQRHQTLPPAGTDGGGSA